MRKRKHQPKRPKDITEGLVVTGKLINPVDEIFPRTGWFDIAIGVKFHGRLSVTQIGEIGQFSTDLPDGFSKFKVLRSHPEYPDLVFISARPSILDGRISLDEEFKESIKLPNVGDVLKCFVQQPNERFGVFVVINRFYTGLIEKSKLSETHVADILAKFPAGSIVTAVVTRVVEEGEKIYLSRLKKDIAKYSNDVALLKREHLVVDNYYPGSVLSCKDFGVFVELENSLDLKGLCHRSELVDDEMIEDASNMFKRGDKVIVKLLSIDEETARLSFGMKPSYFTPQILEKFAALEDENEEEEPSIIIPSEEKSNRMVDIDGSNETEPEKTLMDLVEASTDIENEEIPAQPKKKIKLIDEGVTITGKEYKKILADIELTPNDSLSWIKAITKLVSVQNLNYATKLTFKALKIIDPRQENERWNVWYCFMKILSSDETEESEKSTFESLKREGLVLFNKEKVYSTLAKVLEDVDNFERTDKYLVEASKQAKHQKENYWIERLRIRFKYGSKTDNKKLVFEAREKVLKLATQQLPHKKHPYVLLMLARFEFNSKQYKLALPERAETICQSLLSTFPKRSDIWHQVLDIEIKHKQKTDTYTTQIRTLFERVSTMSFKMKIMKGYFKKWLQFEKQFGSDEDQELVKQKARNYVKSLTEGE